MTDEALFLRGSNIRQFERKLKTRCLGKHVTFYPRTSSTNDRALEAARDGAPHGSVFAADLQDAGRGRRGRNWGCPPRQGLLFSVIVRAGISAKSMGWLPLLSGISCANAIAPFAPELAAVTIKWPNDIVIPSRAAPGWKKLGGILCESTLAAHSAESCAIIGIGINVNQARDQLPPLAKAPPSSMSFEASKLFDRKEVLRSLLENLEAGLDLLTSDSQDLRNSIGKKMQAWLTPARQLTFYSPSSDHPGAAAQHGAFAGLDEFGRILIKQRCVIHAFADAEITALD